MIPILREIFGRITIMSRRSSSGGPQSDHLILVEGSASGSPWHVGFEQSVDGREVC